MSSLAALVAAHPKVPVPRLLWRLAMWSTFRRIGYAPVVRVHDGARMRLTPARGDHGAATAAYLLREHCEPSVRAIIDRSLSPGGVAMDIGANLGLWSLRMAARVGPRGKVIAFEPSPQTFERLRHNLDLSGATQVEAVNCALGEAQGEMTLHIPDDPGSASLSQVEGATRQARVRVDTLDAIWTAQGRPRIDFIKIDVEGAEPLVVKGGAHCLGAAQCPICCEVNPPALKRFGFGSHDLFKAFAALDYRPMRWLEDEQALVAIEAPGEGEVMDVVFLHASSPEIASL